MKVAAIQTVSGTTVQGNLDDASSLLEQAAAGGAELAVLPEYFCLMGRQDTDKLGVREAQGDFLRDPADTREVSSGDSKVPTDKFALRFVKP
jgi:predicted amidohydrolase